jgi:putative transposase
VPIICFRVMYAFVVLAHGRRRRIHFNVTAHPTAEWASQQIVHAFPWDTVPRYLIRDRDGTYGEDFHQRTKETGNHEVLIEIRLS